MQVAWRGKDDWLPRAGRSGELSTTSIALITNEHVHNAIW